MADRNVMGSNKFTLPSIGWLHCMVSNIWTDEVIEFKGQFYSIPASKIVPKPVQKPHHPILLGGFSPNTFSRIVNYVDGWIPVAGFGRFNVPFC